MPKDAKQRVVRLTSQQITERLVDAAMTLLAEEGPSEIKARSVAEVAQVSTMSVYYHLGGLPELLQAVIDKGFEDLNRAFHAVTRTEDPAADLFGIAVACRQLAQSNPHLYDLMFGLSTRGGYRQLRRSRTTHSGRSEAFKAAYSYLVGECARFVDSGRVRSDQDPEAIATQLWSCVHGFVTLELGDHFAQFQDPVRDVLQPMMVNLLVGMGDAADQARTSVAITPCAR
ncbi:TetR/AcrR family transcriptional regulator [Hoyosella subflava]|uniref:Transcriptional regulator n=1 Tax=Hoyosella subflava (strain DSM 45089 / JCM 17490 / NBRC 109087 / DQS3-9A1) TaxID=443218 RepID=F6EQE7_HOYSD|nr:TetR/AcrR family transcriptional regulator [Hoyosella subflava]AEF40632.1 Transcriptional regulator [Hoyosella subflava DQS3-9A1]